MRLLFTLLSTCLLLTNVLSQSPRLQQQSTTTLGTDPEGSARLNGMSFQQDALTTFNGWQYIAYYEATSTYNAQQIVLGRRNLNGGNGSPSQWQTFKFTDYTQRTQDSHNTISLGISPDGRIHLSYDHHDVPLNYRISHQGIASNPNSYAWSPSLFGSNLRYLPGAGNGPWTPVTYPRFLRAGSEFLFEMRIGASGSGDSWLYRYTGNGNWAAVGRYIQGSNNNAYLNGLDYSPATGSTPARLHISWTWRETPDVNTNHDLCYAYSEDFGRTWKSSGGTNLGATIRPSSPGITVFGIGQNSGILNQEGQVADTHGRFHVINRERVNGALTWIHYWRSSSGSWTRNAGLPHSLASLTQTGRRAKLATDPAGNLFAILPQNQNGYQIEVLVSTPGGNFRDWTSVWRGGNWDVEPGYDRYLLGSGGWLSLFVVSQGGFPNRKVGTVDLRFG